MKHLINLNFKIILNIHFNRIRIKMHKIKIFPSNISIIKLQIKYPQIIKLRVIIFRKEIHLDRIKIKKVNKIIYNKINH